MSIKIVNETEKTKFIQVEYSNKGIEDSTLDYLNQYLLNIVGNENFARVGIRRKILNLKRFLNAIENKK